MKEENVIFENQGQKISGVLHTPEKETKSAIVFCHGFTGDKNESGNKFIKAARKLCENGFAALRFDFRGSGASDGKFVDMTNAGEADDLHAAIDFVQGLGYEKIGVVGLSLGGAVCVLANDPRVRSMVLWAPALVLKEVFFRENRISQQMVDEALTKGYVKYIEKSTGAEFELGKTFIQEVKTLDTFNAMKKISCPLLIIHGNADDIVDYRYSEKFIRFASGQKQLKIISEADHSFAIPQHEQQLIEATVEWFNKWLK
jgi:hypothetical protein